MRQEVTRLDSDPRYEAARDKLMGIRLKLREIEGAINQSNMRLGAGSAARKAELEAQARSYLEAGQVPSVSIGPSSPELERLHLERRIARRAEELAAKDLEKICDVISREVSHEQESRNRELTQAIAMHVRQLVEAAKAYKSFQEEFRDAGLACLLPVGAFPFLGFSTEMNGGGIAASWLAQVERDGLIR